MVYVAKPLADRFWRHVERRGPDECWPWTGATSDSGHGRMADKRKHLAAHRASWILHNGPIPDGQVVCHRCDSPPCCNPAHLFLGTQLDNIDDMHAKGRASGGRTPRPGMAHPNAVLTDDDVRSIRLRAAAGEGVRAIAADLGLTPSHISRIVSRKAWSHVE